MQMGLLDGRMAMVDKRMNSLELEAKKINGIESGVAEDKEGLAMIMETLLKGKKEQQNPHEHVNQGDSEEEECGYEDAVQQWTEGENSPTLHLSINAMEGQPYLNTIRLKGTLNLCAITILIDSGSTYNFIDPKTVIKTHCQPTEIPNTLVTIANGTKVGSTAVCKGLKWSMQGHDCCSDMKDDRVLENFNPKAAAGSAKKQVTRKRKGHNGGKLSAPHITMIAVASVTFSLFLTLLCLWHMSWLGRERFPDEAEKRIGLPNGPVSVRQIIDATNNFSAKMEIGRGGFGIVYKAQLHGQIVAVKKLSTPSKQKLQEFNTEVHTLSSLKHENLVQLYGGYSGKELHLLIYEYMEHKSIAEALFETRSPLKLNWKTRREICLGIAKGLKYLHEESRLKIVHRDIKAQNILLGGTDGNLKAKISDFGLAMLCEEGNENMVSRVAGTNGYLAPEYTMRGILSQKADVYGFGVLLLEIVSEKSNAVSRPTQETLFLLDTAYVYNKEGRLADLVDKDLSSCYDFTEAMRILNLAMMCTSQTPTLRPTMSEVVSVLQDEKTVEQVFGALPPDSSSTTMAGAYLTSSAEISSSSTSTEAYVYNKEGRLADLVDKDLSSCYDFTEAMRILNLAMMCTSQTPTLRPTMSEVVSVLQDEKTVEQVFGTPPIDSSSTIMTGAYLTPSAEISSISTEVPSSAFTSYFMIKENQK
ncbi:hypothetical protein RJ639_035156 [Escallonia herrerae]|uniref:Protein kinase domain-containing protein n=1 Tax=Escallonia herrerae TaxID=1293975 RepID=A0AA88WRT1_9ASTE|nr:hypothetical protein RJ639_035156 [Escallonia herrerae]